MSWQVCTELENIHWYQVCFSKWCGRMYALGLDQRCYRSLNVHRTHTSCSTYTSQTLAAGEHGTLSLERGFVGQRYSLSKIKIRFALANPLFALAGPGNFTDSRTGAENVSIVLWNSSLNTEYRETYPKAVAGSDLSEEGKRFSMLYVGYLEPYTCRKMLVDLARFSSCRENLGLEG